MNYELVNGMPVPTVKAITGVSRRHDTVTVNAIAFLHQRLRGKSCRPSTQDQSIRTFRGTRRPEVLIECGPRDDRSLAASEPRVVIEVLSRSTTRYDRVEKLAEYQAHRAIRVILLVNTEAAIVSVWRRGEDGRWNTETVEDLEAVIPLPEIEAELPLAELHLDLSFDRVRPRSDSAQEVRKQAEEAHQDQVKRHDVVEQARRQEDEHARHERDQRRKRDGSEIHSDISQSDHQSSSGGARPPIGQFRGGPPASMNQSPFVQARPYAASRRYFAVGSTVNGALSPDTGAANSRRCSSRVDWKKG